MRERCSTPCPVTTPICAGQVNPAFCNLKNASIREDEGATVVVAASDWSALAARKRLSNLASFGPPATVEGIKASYPVNPAGANSGDGVVPEAPVGPV